MQKLHPEAPNGARVFFSPTTPDLAGILGDMHFDFENFGLQIFFGFGSEFLDFQVRKFPVIWPGWTGLAQGWAAEWVLG